MLDPKRLLGEFLGPQQAAQLGQVLQRGAGGSSMLPGAAAGGLLALLMGSKKTRKLGGNLLTYGGAAVLGGLAWKAWRDWQGGQPPEGVTPAPASGAVQTLALPTPPKGSSFDLQDDEESGHRRLAVVRAMIAAAKADGHIDADEQKDLFARIGELQLDTDEKAFVMDELGKPLDPESIVALASSTEEAAELWLASRLAIDPDDFRERAWLDELARRWKLPEDLVAHLEAQAVAAGQ